MIGKYRHAGPGSVGRLAGSLGGGLWGSWGIQGRYMIVLTHGMLTGDRSHLCGNRTFAEWSERHTHSLPGSTILEMEKQKSREIELSERISLVFSELSIQSLYYQYL